MCNVLDVIVLPVFRCRHRRCCFASFFVFLFLVVLSFAVHQALPIYPICVSRVLHSKLFSLPSTLLPSGSLTLTEMLLSQPIPTAKTKLRKIRKKKTATTNIPFDAKQNTRKKVAQFSHPFGVGGFSFLVGCMPYGSRSMST